MIAPRFWLAVCLMASAAAQTCAEDRSAELQKLLADFDAAQTTYDARQSEFPADATDLDRINRYKSYPRWTYLPKFLAIAQADPSDPAALEASKWIIDQGRHVGNQWRPLYEAETTAWRVVEGQPLPEEEISRLCLIAARRRSPAREAFLRTMAARTDLAGNSQAFAVASLAEYLAQRADEAEAGGFDVPITFETPYFNPDVKMLGQQARRSLHILKRLVADAPAPDAEGRDLDGNPLRLSDYRGKVVLLSFWYPTCSPCLESVPEEQELLERFRDEPFALLGVCRDDDVAVSKKTAEDHGMTWPSSVDGKPGAITGDYNVTSWPKFYLLDAEGRIVSKNVPVGKLASAVEAILHPRDIAGERSSGSSSQVSQ